MPLTPSPQLLATPGEARGHSRPLLSGPTGDLPIREPPHARQEHSQLLEGPEGLYAARGLRDLLLREQLLFWGAEPNGHIERCCGQEPGKPPRVLDAPQGGREPVP